MIKILSAIVLSMAAPLLGQWIHVAIPGTARASDGKPNLSAPTPKAPDGKPDLSGIWSRPMRETKYMLNLATDVADMSFQPWAEMLYAQRVAHVRGKQMSFELTYPDGRKEMILDVPKYDFNWQIWYDTAIKVPKGTKMHVVAHFDNSPNNKYNPNPNKTVYYGDMTWDEMMFPSYGLVVEDKTLDQKMVLKGRTYF